MCEGINNKAITTITSNLKSIVALNVSWTDLTSESITTLVNTVSPTLLRLNIAGSRKSLTDSGKISKFMNK